MLRDRCRQIRDEQVSVVSACLGSSLSQALLKEIERLALEQALREMQ